MTLTSEDPGVEQLLHQSASQVTLFTLSWCSFCHAEKQLLDNLKVPFTLIELDTGSYRATDIHNRMRNELRQLTGSNTLPQLFVGQTPVGGYTDTMAALRNGSLKLLLAKHGITIR